MNVLNLFNILITLLLDLLQRLELQRRKEIYTEIIRSS